MLKKDLKGNLIEKTDSEVFKLYGHLTKDEHSMYHINGDEKYKPGIKENGEFCDYNIGNNKYLEFNFIKSGDDLATYNIAKKAKEYLENLKKDFK